MKSIGKKESLTLFILILFIQSHSILSTQETTESKVNLSNQNSMEDNQIPLMPEEMPEELRSMQSQLARSYGLAYKENFPRFSQLESKTFALNKELEKLATRDQVNKPDQSVPWTLNRERWNDETPVRIASAWSNSVFDKTVFFIRKFFPASNAIYGKSYWMSRGFHKPNQVVIWEATLYKITRVHAINMIWAFAPREYQIEYSFNGFDYKVLVPWRNSVEGGTRGWWLRLFPNYKWRYQSFADRITFNEPKFAIKIKISMRDAVNLFFGLYKVDLLVRNWVVMIKNTPDRQCQESCWTVNTLHPQAGTAIQYANCLKQISLTENRELFILNPEGVLYHYATGLCVTTAHDKLVKLEDCWGAVMKNDGRTYFIFKEDNSISTHFEKKSCVVVPTNPKDENLAKKASKVEVSSVVGTGVHLGNRAIDGNDNTYWASHPGDKLVVYTLYFPSEITANKVKIKWYYPAKNYDILVLTNERGWKHMYKVQGNSKRETSHDLKLSNLKAIQIKMTENALQYMGLPIYGITDIYLDDGGIKLGRKECQKVKDESSMTWYLDEQYYYIISEKKPWVEAWNKLTQTYLKLRSLSRQIHLNWKVVLPTKNKAKHLQELMRKVMKEMSSVLEKLKVYRSMELNSIIHPKFIDIIEKYRIENYFEQGVGDEKASYGVTIENPALDCYMIKKIIPTKKSGFYWIKPRCSHKPLRVFCDFSISGKGVSILIHNDNQSPNTAMEGAILESFRDIRYQCALNGLEPIQIKSTDFLKRILQLLGIYGWDLARPLVVPLGYDYECEDFACAGEYQSLNKKETAAIQDLFQAKLNFYDKIGQKSKGKKGPYVGYGYSRLGKPTYFNLKDSNVTALICSTNKYGPKKSSEAVSVKCEDNLLTNEALNPGPNNSVKVICPSFCGRISAPIFGTGLYTEKSSVCKAAIHAGHIKDIEGGTIIIKISGKKSNFRGSKANTIISKDFQSNSTTTFTVGPNDDKCPIDYNKDPNNQPTSFIETAASSSLSLATKEKAKVSLMEKTEIMSEEMPCKTNTETGIKFMKESRSTDYVDFKEYQKFGKYMQVLIDKFKQEMAWARNPAPLSVSSLNRTFFKLKTYLNNLLRLADRLRLKSLGRLDYTKNIYVRLREIMRKLGKNVEYKIDYSTIKEYWHAYDSYKASNYPSNWIITSSQLQGKSQALFQTKPIKSQFAGSFYVLKYKMYYDFILNLEIMTRNSGTIGVVWRFKNPFNFYALKISKKRGIKKIIKSTNGKYTTLYKIKDGGLFQNQWFKIQVVMKRQNMIIKFGESSKYGSFDNLPLIANLDDYDHREGTVGLLVNGNKAFYADAFHVSPLSCWTPWVPKEDVSVVTDRANVYDELYIGDAHKKYTKQDPESMLNGPSQWRFENDIGGRDTVIYQKSDISDKSNFKEHTMFVLNNKYIRRGWYSAHLMGLKPGIIGLVFKYVDESNYYLLEIGGGKKQQKFFQLRKKIQGSMKLIKRINTIKEIPEEERNKSESFGYRPLKWYYIRIVMNEKGFKVFYSKIGYPEKKIFEIKDRELEVGLVGVSSFATPAAFDNIMMRPKVEDPTLNFNPDDLPAGFNPDEDAYFYGISTPEEDTPNANKDKGPKLKKTKTIPWTQCLRNRTPEQRGSYCKKRFKNLMGLKRKCQSDFCNFCCEKKVPWVHRTHLYSCKKQCKLMTKGSKGATAALKWKDLCINVAKPEFSVYAYCDDAFKGIINVSKCKLDTCRLCCVTTDEVRNTDLGLTTLNKCFEACATAFIPKPKAIE